MSLMTGSNVEACALNHARGERKLEIALFSVPFVFSPFRAPRYKTWTVLTVSRQPSTSLSLCSMYSFDRCFFISLDYAGFSLFLSLIHVLSLFELI